MPTSRWTPRLRWTRALFFALLVGVSAVVQLSAQTVDVAAEARWWRALPVFAVSALIGYGVAWLLHASNTRRYLLVAAFGVVTAFAHLEVAPAVMLANRGEEVRATVVELRVSDNRRGDNVHYTVAGPDGKRLPGEWTNGRTQRDPGTYRTQADLDRDTWSPQRKDEVEAIGSTVPLVADPQGLFHPQTPDVVDAAGGLQVLALVVALVALLLALNAGGPLGAAWTPEQLAADEARRRKRQLPTGQDS